jgi:hypothetical protein
MTREQTDTAFKLIAELAIAANALEQYGNARIGGIIRRASDLLEQMVAEAEAKERAEHEGV